jgi:hypothetical protein
MGDFFRLCVAAFETGAGRDSLHTGEVQGSIPCASTRFKGFLSPSPVFPTVASHTEGACKSALPRVRCRVAIHVAKRR